MAPRSTPTRKAVRSLSWLAALLVGLTGLVFVGTMLWGWQWAPKLGLDLQGGTQIILTPKLESGQEVTQDQLDQAVAIIRQRVDATGVSEAQIGTQGNNIVVEIPGTLDSATQDRIQAAAKLEFRAVLLAGAPTNDSAASSSPNPTDSANPSPSPTPSKSLSNVPTSSPSNGSDDAWITPALQDQYDNFDCATLKTADTNVAPSDQPLVTCDITGTEKFLLGPVEVSGTTITDATAGIVQSSQGVSTGQWSVNIVFNGEGTQQFADVTTRLVAETGDKNRFAIVLDGRVISAPTTQAAITDGKPQITGSFDQTTATTLADQLKYGSLPVSFTIQSTDSISPTLGTAQLASGIIAGLIGLLLVVIYSLFQYRLLGFVTVASLIVAGLLTYLTINILSWREGYRLSLAGVAGLIVAIGFTADSFIVYFERIRDELRDGRGLVGAVEAGWKRAIRTIFAAKSVNLLSAIILFILAVGNVQGFAVTLGLTTVIDVLIVILFTHPVLQLLATTKYFSSGHPLSGLDPTALGAVYRGRAQFRTTVAARGAGASREAERRQTIAERKAAELADKTTSKSTGASGKDSQ